MANVPERDSLRSPVRIMSDAKEMNYRQNNRRERRYGGRRGQTNRNDSLGESEGKGSSSPPPPLLVRDPWLRRATGD